MKNRKLRALCLGIALMLLFACIPAQAADDGNGEITIAFRENQDINYNREGIHVAVYLLATGDYGDWTMLSNFSDIKVFTRGDGSINPDVSLNRIAQRISERNIRPTAAANTDGDGQVNFKNLKHGIYFVDYSNLPDNLKVNRQFLALPGTDGKTVGTAWATAEPQVTPTPTPVQTQTPSIPTASPTPTPRPTPSPTPSPHTLTIYYRYLADDSTAWPTYFQDGLWPGTDYRIPSPVIPGYECTLLVVEGTMPDHDMVYYVYYFKTDETIIDDYETALGIGNIQMHVGVCFE